MPQTKVFFIETRTEEKRALLCRWVEYFYETGRKVQIVVDSGMAAQHLDQLLWTYSQSSFVPHRIISSSGSLPLPEPVVITVGPTTVEGYDVLAADGEITLESIDRYALAILFVLMDDLEKRQESRLIWQLAKEKGFTLQHVPYSARANPESLVN